MLYYFSDNKETRWLRNLLKFYLYSPVKLQGDSCSIHIVYSILLLMHIVKIMLITSQVWTIRIHRYKIHCFKPLSLNSVLVVYYSIGVPSYSHLFPFPMFPIVFALTYPRAGRSHDPSFPRDLTILSNFSEK
jgi:hypothetical protein